MNNKQHQNKKNTSRRGRKHLSSKYLEGMKPYSFHYNAYVNRSNFVIEEFRIFII